MSSEIAILGWGSLLWDPCEEFDRWHDKWRYDGPILKLEFSRISTKRGEALTLVVDSKHGVENTVAWCLSTRENPLDTIDDLRSREDTTRKKIGSLVLANPLPKDDTSMNIGIWAKEQKLDVVVWTALPSNFAEKVGQPFSIPCAIAYLEGLPPEGKAKAAEYISRAPEFIRTPLRTTVEREPWFP